MKHTLLYIMLLTVSLTANAQIENLDEIELLGTWNVSGSFGAFSYQDRGAIQAIEFSDGGYTRLTFLDGLQTVDWFFKGYWITSAKANNYLLHLLPWNGGESIVNFRIKEFADNTMTLTAYNGNGTIILSKDTSVGVRSVSTDAGENSKAYLLNGSVAPENSKGVVISDGKKVIR